MVAGFYGSRRSAIELLGGVNDSSCQWKSWLFLFQGSL